MAIHDTFKLRYFVCPCGESLSHYRWGKDEALPCPVCQTPMEETDRIQRFGKSAAIHGDEIDVDIRHGLCHEDGTPRKFRSRSELRKAAYDAGLTYGTETPKPNPKIVEERLAKGIPH